MTSFLTGLIAFVAFFALFSKLYFLARTRLGWLVMQTNVFYEAFCRGRRRRWHVDALLFVVVGAGLVALWGGLAGAVWYMVYGLAWVHALLTDLRWRNGVMTVQDARYAGKIPLPVPKLIVQLHGPVLTRGREYDLGAWPVGRIERYEFIILNPADKVHCQFPFDFQMQSSSQSVEILGNVSGEHRGPDPGEVVRLAFALKASAAGGPVTIGYRLTLGSYALEGRLRIASVFDPASVQVKSVKVDRWKGGSRGAWCWRGDVDLYDPATWQSAEGLRPSFELSRRFRVPHTVLLSARLSLDMAQSAAHSKALGLDRRSHEIPEYIRWLREKVDFRNEMDWPFQSEKRYHCELGNHYWLHYGTHSAADAGNNWKLGARPGDGRYFWTNANGDTTQEQTDNCLQCVKAFQQHLGVTPSIWGIPGRVNDADTPAAIEAAGMSCSSDSDCQAWTNVFLQPPPHHPAGAERLVELSKKYPGDPQDGAQLAMLKYWTYAARRNKRVMVFMAHHHLRGYEGASCLRLTEEMIREVLAEGRGDFYVATMSAIGMYWERVLCPKHRCVSARPGQGLIVEVSNTGSVDLHSIPVEVEFSNGTRTLTLVDIPADGATRVSLCGARPSDINDPAPGQGTQPAIL